MALSRVMHSGFLPPTEAKPHICAATAGELFQNHLSDLGSL